MLDMCGGECSSGRQVNHSGPWAFGEKHPLSQDMWKMNAPLGNSGGQVQALLLSFCLCVRQIFPVSLLLLYPHDLWGFTSYGLWVSKGVFCEG